MKPVRNHRRHPAHRPSTSWGSVAKQYGSVVHEADSFQQALLKPNILRNLGELRGKQLIDIGCGEGVFARELAKCGAQVTGVDIAPEMIQLARQTSPRQIAFHVAPSHQLPFAKDASFDIAIIILAIQNIERLNETMQECARLLKPSGLLLMVINHPAFRIPKRTSWQWDDGGRLQYRRVDGYMTPRTESIDMDPGKREGKRFTYSFHRPLQDYVQALSTNGLLLDRLEEWISHKRSEKGARAKAEDNARQEFPLFMMLRAIKQVKPTNPK